MTNQPPTKRPYEHLIVWQESHILCLHARTILSKFPDDERFELCSQIRRAAYSIPKNIVEGNSRRSKKSKLQFISYSAGSIEELDYQLLLARDLKYISEAEFQILRKQIGKVSYLLDRLKKSIQSKE